ncbi:MAG: hypothetical protein AAFY81_11990 [Pseudomonadota bacterium]
MSGAADTANTALHARLGWIAGLMFASGGMVLALKTTGAVNGSTAAALSAFPVGLMIGFFVVARKAQAVANPAGRAARRYLVGMFATSMAYLLGFGIAMSVWRNLEPSHGTTWLLALLPILPIMAMIFVMGRYAVEEQDEFLRQRFISASLIGLGFVLVLGNFWGFLETFELVPHVPGWWTVPAWAIGMGAGQSWLSWRDRRHDMAEDDDDSDQDGGMAA